MRLLLAKINLVHNKLRLGNIKLKNTTYFKYRLLPQKGKHLAFLRITNVKNETEMHLVSW